MNMTSPVIVLEQNGIRVDGLPISLGTLAELLNAIARPDPRRWLRFERANDYAMVHVLMEEQGPPMKCDSCGFITSFRRYKYCPVDGTILTSNPPMEVRYGTQENGSTPMVRGAADHNDTSEEVGGSRSLDRASRQ